MYYLVLLLWVLLWHGPGIVGVRTYLLLLLHAVLSHIYHTTYILLYPTIYERSRKICYKKYVAFFCLSVTPRWKFVVHTNSTQVLHRNSTQVLHTNTNSTKVQHKNSTHILHVNSTEVVHTNSTQVLHTNSTKVQHTNSTKVLHTNRVDMPQHMYVSPVLHAVT